MRTQKIVLPAKLSPPRLSTAVDRERLFVWLDAQRDHSAVWVHGTPGAGKTILLASYCRARKRRCLWYRFDADDNDVGQFFGTLGQAVDALRIRAPLPVFAVEHLGRAREFARAWFRAAFSCMPRPFTLVFDNLEHAALPILPVLLAALIDELPDRITALMASRHAPPPELSPAIMAGTLVVLDSAALEFTAGEVTDYARAFGLDESEVGAAAHRGHGWAAGLRILGKTEPQTNNMHQAARLSEYFSELLRVECDANDRQLLLAAALLPWIPVELAARLTGVDNSARRLDELCAKNLFVEHIEHAPTVYRLHPLLREFLLNHGRQALEPGHRRELLLQAAHGFEAMAELDHALDLLLDAGDWKRAIEMLLDGIETKLMQGRLDQLAAWIKRLPVSELDREPALHYGLARICFLREDGAAVQHYERSFNLFAAQGDLLGQQLCAAGVLEWSYNTDNFIGHERWGTLLRQPAPENPAARDEMQTLRLLNGKLLACFFDGEFDADAKQWTEEILGLLTPGGAENEKLSTAITLLGCLERHKRWDDAQLLAGKMEALLDSGSIGIRLKIIARQQIAIDFHRQTGDYDGLRRMARQAREMANQHGFHVLEFEAVAALLYAALYTGDETESQKLLGEISGMMDPASIYHQRFSHQMRTWLSLQRGQLVAAQEHADALRAAVAHSDMPARFRATWLQLAVFATFAAGKHEAACAELSANLADAESGSRQILQATLLSLRAWMHFNRGQLRDAESVLEQAWSLAASNRYYGLLAPLRGVLSQLSNFALERAVLPDFARELVARRRLRAPVFATADWPWLLRIHTLGQFALIVDQTSLNFSGKVPKKPLSLLKALIAHGASEVPEHVLTDALWPDEDADAAHIALNVALHRLRKLLPNGNEIVRLQEGRLSLDGDACWIDSRVFEQYVAAVDDALAGGTDATLALHRALVLYRGHFLSEDRDEPWSLSARERLRSKFNRIVVACGSALSAAGRDVEALECYRRGIETDDLAEDFYQGAMQCALVLKRSAEGLATYQRLERMLSLSLGIKPSPASQSLRRQLLEC